MHSIKNKLTEVENAGIQDFPPTPYIDPMAKKLKHFDTHLSYLSQALGGETKKIEEPFFSEEPNARSPLKKFLGLLSDSEHRLTILSKDIEDMAKNEKSLNVGAMLLLQVKANYMTQEVSFFSNMLNQALTSIKTVLNVQV